MSAPASRRHDGAGGVGRIYRALFHTVFVRMDPERAHHLAATGIGVAGRVVPLRAAVAATFGRLPDGPVSPLLGREVHSRLGAAAGFDKDATMVEGLVALGFGFVEIGTVTAHAQPGNDRPRLFRLVPERALVNRMGFNNSGSAAVARRLQAVRARRGGRDLVIGVNIGKTKVTPPEHAAQDYALSARALAPYADYLVVNVSSPNTPGLRDLQSVDALRPILVAAQEAADAASGSRLPVLVKIAPDLDDEDLRAIAALVTELDLAGVVATNTTIDHDHGPGGLSGPPLAGRARQVVALLRRELGPDRTIIGVGGISTGGDARALVDAGADAVQAYTAFIYAGPAWPGRIARALGAVGRVDR